MTPTKPDTNPTGERLPAAPPVDLDLRVKTVEGPGELVLEYQLHSPTGAAEVYHETIRSEPLRNPDAFKTSLFKQLSQLHDGKATRGETLLEEEIERDLESLGHLLYERLFPKPMRDAYRRFRHVGSLRITTDEPWIPWELVKADEDDADDDFFCLQFRLSRWLAEVPPVSAIRIERLAVIEAGESDEMAVLPKAGSEAAALDSLGKEMGVDVERCPGSPFQRLERLLYEGGRQLYHFVGHGEFNAEQPDESRLLMGELSFRSRHLTGAIARRLRKDRPLVFASACEVGQQGWSLTGLGGWAERWVKGCGCSAFLGPHWRVKDDRTGKFADAFYRHLRDGQPLGEAVREARRELKAKHPGKLDWLAYSLYGHPNARVTFGQSPDSHDDSDPLSDLRSGTVEALTHFPLTPISFVGRDDDLRELKARLLSTAGTESQGPPLILMTGWPGVGKTTMSMALANDSEMRAKFPDSVLWTSLDQSPSLLSELNSWCIALGSPSLSLRATLDEAARHLGGLLRERKALLVVDDVWEPAHAIPFLVGGPGCAMLVTSRLDDVAQKLAPAPEAVYRLPLLSEAASLELLRDHAPRVLDTYPQECRNLVMELEGLPLALHVAGRMLAEEDRLDWGVEELLVELREGRKLLEAAAPSDRADLRTQTLPTVAVLLAKSTERLPEEILERFTFLGVFAPRPATFGLEALQKIWHIDDPKPTVRQLVRRGLLEPAGAGRFRMHALLVAHARSLLED